MAAQENCVFPVSGLKNRAMLLALLAVLAATGCQQATTTSGESGAVADGLWEPMREAIAELDVERWVPRAGQVPANALLPFPQTAFESWELRAVLRSADGEAWGFQQQWLRLAVSHNTNEAGGASAGQTAASDWRFTDVMAHRQGVARQSDQHFSTDQRQSRVSLGLAGSQSDAGRLWVHDRGMRILSPDVSLADASAGTDACDATYQITGPDGLDLHVKGDRCVDTEVVAGIGLRSLRALPVTGQLPDDEQLIAVQGTAWIQQVFGDMPTAEGPVVFDTVQLDLAGLGHLEVSRSKRRSGQGPVTLQSTLYPGTAGSTETRERSYETGTGVPLVVEWRDEGQQRSVATDLIYPRRWRLRSAAAGIDITLQPLVDLQEVDDPRGARWLGAVVASGSHRGDGFVDYQPVAAAP